MKNISGSHVETSLRRRLDKKRWNCPWTPNKGSCQSLFEVRDSWTGYLVPVRDGPGLLPDWESCWDAAVAVTWKFRSTFWPQGYIWSFQNGGWLMIWEIFGLWDWGFTQNSEPNQSSRVVWPGESFWKKKHSIWWNNCYFEKIPCPQNWKYVCLGKIKLIAAESSY